MLFAEYFLGGSGMKGEYPRSPVKAKNYRHIDGAVDVADGGIIQSIF